MRKNFARSRASRHEFFRLWNVVKTRMNCKSKNYKILPRHHNFFRVIFAGTHLRGKSGRAFK